MPSDTLYAGLTRLEAQVLQAAIAGADEGAAAIEAALKGTAAHGDVTGATRAGYVAYVVAPGADRSSLFDAAAAAVSDRNPAGLQVESGPEAGDDVLLIATTPTSYQQYLERDGAGAHATIGPTIDGQAAAVFQAITAALRKVF